MVEETLSRLLIASTNSGKLAEFKALLSGCFECLSPSDPAFAAGTFTDVLEDGLTYQQNAQKKVDSYFSMARVPVLADDSGLEVSVLNGGPGVHSARLGGEKLDWKARWQYLYEQLKPFPQHEWTATFRCVLCFHDGQSVQFFEGTVRGLIAPQPRGENGFGYDALFFCPEIGKTFGEALPSEKEQVSHRSRAVKSFLTWWKSVRLTGQIGIGRVSSNCPGSSVGRAED
ncbi:MAG: non-canonical purine NTP pyrophosphatase [Deltaproteobacteria bacterium]|nr:non-canonical purine NTP pyrophosphatase [Deltaproteobacteria bacterium]